MVATVTWEPSCTSSVYPSLSHGCFASRSRSNTVALSGLVHGYSGKPDLAKMINAFHLQAAGLRTSVYFDYVPSKANIADLPSRLQTEEFLAQMAGLDVRPLGPPSPLAVPSVAQWGLDLDYWLANPYGVNATLPI